MRLRVLLAEATWKDVDGIDVRLAVHSGVAARYGGDLLGPGVNEVSKLCAQAGTEGILVSSRSLDEAGDLPEAWELGEERECTVPGLAMPLAVVDLLPRG
jgi:class 3 adenylate cyclase